MNAQWGTFTQQHGLSFNDTLNAAQTSLERRGYRIFNSTAANEGMVMGGLGDSEDPSAAEQARNIIRQDIQGTINFD